MPKIISDLRKTLETAFSVGGKGGGARAFEFYNGFLGRLLWNPTANRDITVPDAEGTVVLQNNGRIDGLSPAISPGQAVVFEQIGTATTQYEGGLDYHILPSNGTTISTVGGAAPGTSGTISTPSLTTTSAATSTRRTKITGGATAGTVIYIRSVALYFWRGNAANLGGFRVVTRMTTETLVASQRGFWGISDIAAANPTNVDPLASTAGSKVGVGFNTNTGNWQLIHNAAGVAPTVIDLEANFPINVTNVYQLELAALPNADGIDYVFSDITTGNTTSGTLTTNIPSNTTFLAPISWMTNNLTAAAFSFANVRTSLTTPS
jgi:hypothetical protein